MNFNKEKGIQFISLSALFSALFGLFAKLAGAELSVQFLLFMRFFIPLLICAPLFFVAGTFSRLKTSDQLKNATLRSVFMVLSQICFLYYLSKSSLLNASLMYNTAPIYIPLISRYIYSDKSVKIFSKSILISLIGVALIIQPDQTLFMSASIIGLLSGVFLAISQSIVGENVQEKHMDEGLFFSFLISSIFSFLILLIFFFKNIFLGISALANQDLINWVFVLLMGVFTSLSQYFRGQAYVHVKPYMIAPLLNLAIFFSFFFDLFILKKTPDYLSIMGSLLIILGSIMKWYSLGRIKKD